MDPLVSGLFASCIPAGIKPDAIVFNSLLDGCARKEMPVLCEQAPWGYVTFQSGVATGAQHLKGRRKT